MTPATAAPCCSANIAEMCLVVEDRLFDDLFQGQTADVGALDAVLNGTDVKQSEIKVWTQ